MLIFPWFLVAFSRGQLVNLPEISPDLYAEVELLEEATPGLTQAGEVLDPTNPPDVGTFTVKRWWC